MTTQPTHDPTELAERDRVAAIYDEIAPVWDERQGVVERKLMGDAMRVTLGRELRGDVLEIGSGTGATFRHLGDTGAITTITATDLSLGMLRRAAIPAAALDVPVRMARMEAGRLAFADATFDTVTTSLTLCTVPDPAVALREMARVCRPSGRVVLLEHVLPRNPLVALPLRLLTPVQVRLLGCHFDRRTDRLVRELGFRVERDDSRFLGIFRLIVARPPGGRP